MRHQCTTGSQYMHIVRALGRCTRRARFFLCVLALIIFYAAVAVAGSLTSPPPLPSATQTVSPFTITGFIQKTTLDTAKDVLSGGTMQVNGFSIVIPRNAVVTMPGTFLTWGELFSLAPAPWGPTQTGLALADIPKPLTTYEVTVQGNRVIGADKDQYIAALIFVSQQSLNSSQGFINFINYETGEMRIGKTPGDQNGAHVFLNDPLGRFGRVNSPDIRFSIDESNPTVRSATGYPMCVPRLNPSSTANGIADDPLCPQVNRPKDPTTGNFLSVFTMPPPACAAFPAAVDGSPSVVPPNCVLRPPPGSPDVTQQMPFEVGDYVTYNGILVADTNSPGCKASPDRTSGMSHAKCEYISASSMVADIAAFTTPGVMPAYIGVDTTLLGLGGVPAALLPQEATARLKVIGYTTDPSSAVDIYGMDIDPCTGTTKDRYFGTEIVQLTAKKGRFQFQPNGGPFLPPVRQFRVVSRTLSHGLTPAIIDPTNTFANGIVAGQYVAPVMTFLPPENLEVSDSPVPLNVQDIPFLAAGSGPWPGFAPSAAAPLANPSFPTGLTAGEFASDAGPIVSQLTPWPGANPPQPAVCSTTPAQPPVPNAGANQTVVVGSTVQLDGTGSTDPNTPADLPLTYFWVQLSGTPVTLSDTTSATPTFTAPLQPGTLTFSLAVMNNKGVVSPTPATVTIAVTASSSLLVNAGPPQTVHAGALVVLPGAVSDPAATLSWTQVSGPAVNLGGANTLTANFTAPTAQILAPTDLVFRLTATSPSLGTASGTVTVTVMPQVDALLLQAVYRQSKAILTLTVSSTAPGGTATITAAFAGQQIQMGYIPASNSYSAIIVGIPAPPFVTVTSSLGGTTTRQVLVVQ